MSFRIMLKENAFDAAAIECDTVDEVLGLLKAADHLPIVRDSPRQEDLTHYSNSLYYWIMATDKFHGGDSTAAQTIRELWDNEAWDSILDKLRIEGSTWLVWWMDGVRKYAEYDRNQRGNAG
jgi:hypothetical protein